MRLDMPKPPFNSARTSSPSSDAKLQVTSRLVHTSPSSSRDVSPAPQNYRDSVGLATDDSNMSLSVNYLPTKFSSGNLSPVGPRRRGKRQKDTVSGAGGMPKMGGGVDAFRSGEARIGAHGEEDDEGDRMEDGSSRWFNRGSPKGHHKARWNKFKWVLFVANLALTLYCFIGLIFCLLTWFNVWSQTDIIRVGNRTELVVSTLAACLGIFTALIGWAGILMNNRSFLAVYTFLLWIVFIFLLVPGYMTYKRRTFNLEGKVNAQWSQDLGAGGRLRIQNALKCCGYFSPFVEATVSQTCYARSVLPGCKLSYMLFERETLKRWYSIAFALVPVHLAVMIAGLLCSNHVTYRFGKGMMPKAYRLSMTSMAIIMDNYANQLAEQYGSDVASDVLTRSRSNLQLDAMPTMSYEAPGNSTAGVSGRGNKHAAGYTTKYDSLSTRVPSNEGGSTSGLL